jgi:hypothetical protein
MFYLLSLFHPEGVFMQFLFKSARLKFSFLAALVVIPVCTFVEGAAAACTIGETQIRQLPSVIATAPGRMRKGKIYWSTATFKAEDGWAIETFYLNYRGTVNRVNWRWIGTGGSYASPDIVQAAYSPVIDVAGRDGNSDKQAEFLREMEAVASNASQVSPNQGALEITLGVATAGVFRNSRTGIVNPTVKLRCVGTSAQIEVYTQEQLNRLSQSSATQDSMTEGGTPEPSHDGMVSGTPESSMAPQNGIERGTPEPSHDGMVAGTAESSTAPPDSIVDVNIVESSITEDDINQDDITEFGMTEDDIEEKRFV